MGTRSEVLRKSDAQLVGAKATLVSTSYGPWFYGKRTSWGWNCEPRAKHDWSWMTETSVNVAFKFPTWPMKERFRWLGREVNIKIPMDAPYSYWKGRHTISGATEFHTVSAVIVDWVQGSDMDLQEPLVKALGFKDARHYGRREIEITFTGRQFRSPADQQKLRPVG